MRRTGRRRSIHVMDIPFPAGHYRNSARSLYWWMRVVVADRKDFRVQPEDRTEPGAVDAGVADESKQFCILLQQCSLGFATPTLVALVIGAATGRAAGGATEHELNKLRVHVRHHEADQLRPYLRRDPPLAGFLRHPPVPFLSCPSPHLLACLVFAICAAGTAFSGGIGITL